MGGGCGAYSVAKCTGEARACTGGWQRTLRAGPLFLVHLACRGCGRGASSLGLEDELNRTILASRRCPPRSGRSTVPSNTCQDAEMVTPRVGPSCACRRRIALVGGLGGATWAEPRARGGGRWQTTSLRLTPHPATKSGSRGANAPKNAPSVSLILDFGHTDERLRARYQRSAWPADVSIEDTPRLAGL